jgi:hypothetical protein
VSFIDQVCDQLWFSHGSKYFRAVDLVGLFPEIIFDKGVCEQFRWSISGAALRMAMN